MYLTLVNGFQARAITNKIRDTIFTEAMQHAIVAHKAIYVDDNTYNDFRNTVSGKVISLVNTICYLEEPLTPKKLDKIHQLLIHQPIAVQMFFLDRFFYASERFAELGSEFVSGIHTEIQILYYGLIYFWGTRGEKQQ